MFFISKWFIRSPKRNIPKGNNIISPADGKIIRILSYNSKTKLRFRKDLLGTFDLFTKDVAEECWIICIMMNILNIHVQRAPLDAKIKQITYRKGTFKNAVKNARNLEWMENEKNEILMQCKDFKIKVVQVAGLLTKRIKSYQKTDEIVKKGVPIGHIALGSEVVLVIPKRTNIKLNVKEGMKVIDGESIIAFLN